MQSDLLSWVYTKQVHSTAAGKFSLLLNRPTHNSSIFLLRQVPTRPVTALRKKEKDRKGVRDQTNHCRKRKPFQPFFSVSPMWIINRLRRTPMSSLPLCFNTVVNDIGSLPRHILTLFMAQRLPSRHPWLCQCVLNRWPGGLASSSAGRAQQNQPQPQNAA